MSATWLTKFEKQVEKAITELETLRSQNASQQAEIENLQKELEQARDAGDAASDWENERDEVRRRVEELSSQLEELL